jgi:tripartite-type tricarboxylate transporter receptor subunit TctC
MNNNFNHSQRQGARVLLALLPACLAMLVMGTASAESAYPNQPIHLVVPYTPGTGYDNIAREMSPMLSKRLGVTVVVDNRPGVSSLLGTQDVANSKPDGYTILMAGEGTMASAVLYPSAPVNPLTQLEPITLAAYGTLMLVTSSTSGIKTVADLIAKAKQTPGKLTYASPGIGTSQHLKMEMFDEAAGINMLHVPYKGSSGALNDLMGGQVDAALVPIPQAVPQIQGGHLNALAVVSPQRNPRAPSVPTLTEAGIKGVEANMWYAFLAPKGTPADIVKRLNTDLRAVLTDPGVKAKLEGTGIDVATSTPEELHKIMQTESDTARSVISKHHITLD